MEIVDVIYGNFFIPSDVAAIVRTPQFQRLKSIKQLGFLQINDNIEHEHHRYAHCLGTYNAASLMLDALEQNTEWLRDHNNNKIPAVYRRAVQIAALLHDIAHGPFSHGWEHVVKGYRHEIEACACIDYIFKQINEDFFPELRRNNNYGIELIKALIDGSLASFKSKYDLSKNFNFIFEIVSNSRSKLDVDKWDYLKRDYYYLKHMCQPNMDFDDVFLKARVSDCGYHIEYRYEDYNKICNLFTARYHFHLTCYTLPQFLLRDYILSYAIEEIKPKINDILVSDIRGDNMLEFLKLTDNHILQLVAKSEVSEFLLHQAKYQLVKELTKETASVYVEVKSIRVYMPKDESISFYGNIGNKSAHHDSTICVKKIYRCYCNQSTQTVNYTIQEG